jgi:hypothetical protein
MTKAIHQDAIAGHKAAIAKLQKSISDREVQFKNGKHVSPRFLPRINHLHQWEVSQLEILELELKGMQK